MPGPVTGHLDEAGYDVATGVGPDLRISEIVDASSWIVSFYFLRIVLL